MGLSPIHIVILAIVAVLVFGGGRFSTMMGDVAKGVKNFKAGMAEDGEPSDARPLARLDTRPQAAPAADRDPHRTADGSVA